jgi:hypothetical protein
LAQHLRRCSRGGCSTSPSVRNGSKAAGPRLIGSMRALSRAAAIAQRLLLPVMKIAA